MFLLSNAFAGIIGGEEASAVHSSDVDGEDKERDDVLREQVGCDIGVLTTSFEFDATFPSIYVKLGELDHHFRVLVVPVVNVLSIQINNIHLLQGFVWSVGLTLPAFPYVLTFCFKVLPSHHFTSSIELMSFRKKRH